MTQWLLQNAGWIVLLLGVAVGSSWITQWWTPKPEPEMLVNWTQEVFDEDDLMEPTQPKQVDVYEAPTDTTTETIIIPEWLAQRSNTDTSGVARPSRMSNGTTTITPARPQNISSPISLPGGATFNTLPYVITPMTNGSPSLTVRSSEVVLQSLSPRTGRMLEWTYDIPQPSWRIGLRGTVAAGPRMSLGLSTLGYGRRFEWGWMSGWIDLGGGYGVAAVRDQVEIGPIGQVSMQIALIER